MVVLVAVADDHVRDRVLSVALELGTSIDTELYVVHLTTDEVADGDARLIRDELQRTLADAPIDCTVAIEFVGRGGIRSGHRIGHTLVDIASDVEITHIVVGHTSKRLIQNLTQGNTAFAVADGADVPVTIVPDGADVTVD
ncbi:MAG: universal stress protein [Halobacteriota archaeon]